MNIKFRFFQGLSTGQRLAVFKVFGVLADDFDGKLTHSEEAQLLAEMLAGIRGEAYENAAKVAEDTDVATFHHAQILHDDGSQTRSNIASAIRAVRTTELDHEQQTAGIWKAPS